MPMQNFEDRTFSKRSSLQGRIFNMNKQALRKTGRLNGKGNYMNRTSKMVTLFQEKMQLRKDVDCQECLLRMIEYKLFFKERTNYLGKFKQCSEAKNLRFT